MQTLNIILALITTTLCLAMIVQVVRRETITYWAGVQLGFSYFVGAPIFLSAVFGRIRQVDIPIPNMTIDGSPGVYLVTAGVAAIIFLIPNRHIGLPKIKINQNIVQNKKLLHWYTATYLAFSIYGFISSGKLTGGHWYSSHGESMQGDAVAVALLQIRNVMRFTLPFLLLFYKRKELITTRAFCIGLICIAGLELIISGNRIIALTCIISYALAYKSVPKKGYAILLLAAPIIIQANSIFPIVRGMMWSNGLNLQQMSYAVDTAAQHLATSEGQDIQLILSSAFEASNLNMANMVIENYPSKYSYLMGDTFIVRPLTFYLPKAIWPGRPEGFGLTLGRLSGLDVDGLALNSTYIGEAYANFGPFSVLALPLVLWGLSNLFRMFDSNSIQYMTFAVGFAGWRFDLVFSIVAIIVILAICTASKIRFRSKPITQ
ncbi:hypothetical protein N7676_11885 [Stenotrophomonas sp. GD03993]|uniref:hypothetical protein n=1 Tax=unclassified Stenotrophomonas TaxID=196198 RepID=UPI001312DEB7|nr:MULTISPECIES: hypothetical protein [Stenotrophomonas]MBH1461100.1 hypothetical protein [Stenotrophomonas maltophilia]MDH0189388.1 hypothetical protein [Stenotrophomonas sp. GD04051]MDH0464512.1 hypothetical protein [Stenotrophomonas sp. GD03993]MDH0877018.1 hypothetical protein [Stenotrophomonas sp. GD03877]MDH2156538.1 hypothetical protein [Stenotrophomonas sp. GD03657]